MEHAEPKPAMISADEFTKKPKTAAKRERKTPLLKSLYWAVSVFFVVQVLLILALAWFVRSLAAQLEATRSEMGDQAIQTTLLSERTTALRHEFQSLREVISSQAAVDIIYLKMLILKSDLDKDLAGEIAKHVHHYSLLYDQDPDLVLSIMAIESRFDPNAQSHKGALGLMQIMPQWKKVLGIKEDLNDPGTSVKYGLQILGFYREMYKDLDLLLTAYNRGPGPVDMALMRERDPKNGYSDKVLEVYNRLKSIELKSY